MPTQLPAVADAGCCGLLPCTTTHAAPGTASSVPPTPPPALAPARPPVCRPPRSEQHEAASGPLTAQQQAPAGADSTEVVGSLANSYASYQLRLSARLAKEHHGLR